MQLLEVVTGHSQFLSHFSIPQAIPTWVPVRRSPGARAWASSRAPWRARSHPARASLADLRASVERLEPRPSPMQKVAKLLALASALCHIATLSVLLMQTTRHGAVPGGSHRNLESTEHDHVVTTVARLERAIDTQAATVNAIQAQLHALQERDSEFETSIHALRRNQRRGLQAAEPEIGENVRIIKPAVVHCGHDYHPAADGHFDSARCASDRAFATCHAEACASHRRGQAGEGYGEGSCADLESRSAEVTRVCCDEPEEDCTGGRPQSCNVGCAATFLPFWHDCQATMGKDSALFEPVVAMCMASADPAHASLAEQLNLQCTDGTSAAECVPQCSEQYHGYLMLLNIDGDDSKLSCEVHHGYYSWVGAAVHDRHSLLFPFPLQQPTPTRFVTCLPCRRPMADISARISRRSSQRWCLERLVCTSESCLRTRASRLTWSCGPVSALTSAATPP